jgi:hypothetical protein
MSRRRSSPLAATVLAAAALALAGCGRLTRVATINQTTQTPGARVQAVLEQQLAKQGVSSPQVTCAKHLIVNVGTTATCSLTGAGSKTLVRFTFANSHGDVKLASVKAV